jgi:hypothetical protein
MKTNMIVVDVESDGPCPGLYSMVCFGAVSVDDPNKSFYGCTRAMFDKYQPETLKISGFTREEHLNFSLPLTIMADFDSWVRFITPNGRRPVFVSDNLAFDWQWINWYFHYFIGHNPFGFSGRRIGDLYCGLKKNLKLNSEWKKLRVTTHTHNPVDDAMGNVEALKEILKEFKI